MVFEKQRNIVCRRLYRLQRADPSATHIIPSYSPFRSKGAPHVRNKYLRAVLERIRAFLLEDVFTGGPSLALCPVTLLNDPSFPDLFRDQQLDH